MATTKKVPGSVLNQHKIIVYGSRNQKDVAKKEAFRSWLGNYINYINTKRFNYIKEINDKKTTLAEQNIIVVKLDDAERLLFLMKDLYEKVSKDLGLSEQDSTLDGEVKQIDMEESQKYIQALIDHARACFADYMMTKYAKPDRSKVALLQGDAQRKLEREEEVYESGVNLARARYDSRASLANLLIVEHYDIAQKMGMKKPQVSFSYGRLPCGRNFYNSEKEEDFLDKAIVEPEKKLYDKLYEQYIDCYEKYKVDPDSDESILKMAEEMMELQKMNILDLQKSKKYYEKILEDEDESKK